MERLWQIAHQIGDLAIVTTADRLMGITLLPLGRLQEAQQCSERVLQAPISPEDRRRSVYHHSEQPRDGPGGVGVRAVAARLDGKGSLRIEASLGELRGTDHQLSVCPVLYYGLCRIAPMTGDFATADRGIARLIEVASRLDALFWKTVGRFLQGKLMIERREFARGVAEVRGAFDTCRQMGWRASYQEFKGALAVGLTGLSSSTMRWTPSRRGWRASVSARRANGGMSPSCYASRAKCSSSNPRTALSRWPKIVLTKPASWHASWALCFGSCGSPSA